MRADRLIAILLLLQVNQRLNTKELADQLDVSERTIHRDMNALCSAGIPVTSKRGLGGGWGLIEGYQTKLTGLKSSEIQSLFLSQPFELLKDLGLEHSHESAILKLLAAIPKTHHRNAEFVRQRIHIDGKGWHQHNENHAYLPVLQEAIWEDQIVEMTYKRYDESVVKRKAEPLGLIMKGRIWYLVAAVDGKFRTYRISRFIEVQKTDENFVRPKDFHLAEYWEDSTSSFVKDLPRYPAIIKVERRLVGRIRSSWRFARIQQVKDIESEGNSVIEIDFETEHEGCQYMLSLGTKGEVLEPEALRKRVQKTAEEVAAFYSRSATWRKEETNNREKRRPS
ncbi:MAG TPA: WYL domain-containing protein [Bacillales bacterium]|nr:WYL domain-containing protein [Bacillales bacterium]